jgi:hypothetical protein
MRAGGALLALLAASAAHGQTFQKIVGIDEVTPGVNVNFSNVSAPVIDHDQLAFCGQSFMSIGHDGYYRADLLGNVAVVATEQTQLPGGRGTSPELCVTAESGVPSIDGSRVAFYAPFSGGRGMFLDDGVSLSTLVDTTTDFPGTDADELFWESPSLDGHLAVTWRSGAFSGIYSFAGPTLFAVADTNPGTPTSEGPITFFHVSDGSVSGPEAGDPIDTGAYAFGVNQSPTGPFFVYRRRFGALETAELIASAGDPIAGGGVLPEPFSPQMDRSDPEQLCFLGGGFGITGVYRYDGQIERVADVATAIPGGTGNFTDFGLHCAIDDGDVVFTGRGDGDQIGVYVGRAGGALERVADTSTSLDGSLPGFFTTSREAISDGRIAFIADGEIWVTPAPEPSVALAAMTALLALAGVARRR